MSTSRNDPPPDTENVQFQQPIPLWRNLDYLLLWSGQLVSSTGTQVSQLAFPLLVLALTHSPARAGFAGALRALPYLVFSLPAGALIDRWDRKRVMIFCDMGRALSMASIPFALAIGQLTLLQLYLVSTIEGTLFVFFNIAEVACLPNVVSKSQLPAATAQNEATAGMTSLLGPLLGGTLYSLERTLPFVADAISYAISVGSLLLLKANFQQQRITASSRLWVEIREGLAWLWHHPLIRFSAIFAGGINLFFAGFSLVIIVLAQRMHASAFTIGLIFTVGGVGGVLGALVAPSIQKRFRFGQVIISVTWLLALLIALYVVAPNSIMLGVLSALLFTLAPIYNVASLSYRLPLIPDALQGRVNSIARLVSFCGQPLGMTLTGLLIEHTGVIVTTLLTAAGLAVLAAMATLNPHMRVAQLPAEVR